MRALVNRLALETALTERTGAQLVPSERVQQEPLMTGIPALDLLTGGVRRGTITELTGNVSSGRTGLAACILAASAKIGEVVAYIDVTDSLDPESMCRAGVPLDQLLWIRCGHRLEHALRVADLVLSGGGFGVTVFDMADVSLEWARRIPMSYWFRFRRAVENKSGCCLLMDPVPCAGTCAALQLEMRRSAAGWTGDMSFQLLTGARFAVKKKRPAEGSPLQFAVRSDRASSPWNWGPGTNHQ